jgi:hypothetical protein
MLPVGVPYHVVARVFRRVMRLRTLPTPTLTPPKTTYTQNGNCISNPSTPHTRQHTYRQTSPSLSTRRPHPLSGDINVIATRGLWYGRARVHLHQPTINVHRQRPGLSSSYKTERFKQQKKRKQRHTLTPAYGVPGPELARAMHRHQAIDRQQSYMCTPQHIPPCLRMFHGSLY